eukprot:Clim_evm36s22 gene=Clim_evmTU36s22
MKVLGSLVAFLATVSGTTAVDNAASTIKAKMWTAYEKDLRLAPVKQGLREPVSYLPDFSYAGYMYQNSYIPRIPDTPEAAVATGENLFHVKDYGAQINDKVDDTEAIQNAIFAAEKVGGGIVYFNCGYYEIMMQADKPALRISSSNIILKGCTTGDKRTNIIMKRGRDTPSTEGIFGLEIGPKEVQGKGLTRLAGPIEKNTRVMSVESISGLREGMCFRLRYEGFKYARIYYDTPRLPKRKGLIENGFHMNEIHCIERIDALNRVLLLSEPLHISIFEQFLDFEIVEYLHLTNVAVESIDIKGNHHKPFRMRKADPTDRQRYGFSGIRMNNVRNGWIRDMTFTDMTFGIYMNSCSATTIEAITFRGTPGYVTIRLRFTYGVLVQEITDSVGYFFGPSVGFNAVGSVIRKFKMGAKSSTDFHGGLPYATLLEEVRGGTLTPNGGPNNRLPHHGHDMVIWNFHHESGNVNHDYIYDFWSESSSDRHLFMMPFIIGISGYDNFLLETNSCLYYDGLGKRVEPGSLFLSQVKLRHELDQGSAYKYTGVADNAYMPGGNYDGISPGAGVPSLMYIVVIVLVAAFAIFRLYRTL